MNASVLVSISFGSSSSGSSGLDGPLVASCKPVPSGRAIIKDKIQHVNLVNEDKKYTAISGYRF